MTYTTKTFNNNSPDLHLQPKPQPQRVLPDRKESQELLTALRVQAFKESVDEKERIMRENEELRRENERLSRLLRDSQELIDSLQSK